MRVAEIDMTIVQPGGNQRYAAAWMPYSSAYCPFLDISSSWVPISTSRDPSSTTMRSAIRTVEKRCETRIVMRPAVFDGCAPRAPLGGRYARQRRVVDQDGSGRGLVHLRDQLDQRRLAGAVLADDGDD